MVEGRWPELPLYLQQPVQKTPDPLILLSRAEYLLGRPLSQKIPGLHEDDPVGQLPCKAHVVSNDDHGHPLVRQGVDGIKYLSHQLRIEGGGRLVKEHQFRFHGQSPGDGYPLLLPPGKGGGKHPSLSDRPTFASLYFRFFLIRSTASITFSRWPKADSRKYPSPLGPKPEPGVPTTLHSVRSLSKKSQLVIP
jgi:hypothetical protein